MPVGWVPTTGAEFDGAVNAAVISNGCAETSGASVELDWTGSTAGVDGASPVNPCRVCRRNAARPASKTGESPGTCGVPPSADGANPTDDNTVAANGVTTDPGADCTCGVSTLVSVAAGCDATSTTGTVLTAGVRVGADVDCATNPLPGTAPVLFLSPPADPLGAGSLDCFGVIAAADFLPVTEACFLPVWSSPLPLDFAPPEPLLLFGAVDPPAPPTEESEDLTVSDV